MIFVDNFWQNIKSFCKQNSILRMYSNSTEFIQNRTEIDKISQCALYYYKVQKSWAACLFSAGVSITVVLRCKWEKRNKATLMSALWFLSGDCWFWLGLILTHKTFFLVGFQLKIFCSTIGYYQNPMIYFFTHLHLSTTMAMLFLRV